MLDNPHIQFITSADNRSYRKWVIKEVRYDYDHDYYSVKDLSSYYPTKYGTPIKPYKILLHDLIHWEKVLGNDCVFIIKEVEFLDE